MNIEADNYHFIGAGHVFCEDFSLSRVYDRGAHAIISDGCSGGGEGVCIGARLLTRAADSMFRKDVSDPIGKAAWIAQSAAETIGLNQEAMYATLLSVKAQENDFIVDIRGDGTVVARERDTGILHVYNYDYHNSPYYLNYELTNDTANWIGINNSDQCKVRRFQIKDGEIHGTVDAFSRRYDECGSRLSMEKYDLVAVLSDGIDTFYVDGGCPPYGRPEKIQQPINTIISKLFDFKAYQGDFVRRRCKRFLKECAKEGISHFDDFSMAALYRKEYDVRSSETEEECMARKAS